MTNEDLLEQIQTLFEYIHELELRILDIERREGTNPRYTPPQCNADSYYWEHG